MSYTSDATRYRADGMPAGIWDAPKVRTPNLRSLLKASWGRVILKASNKDVAGTIKAITAYLDLESSVEVLERAELATQLTRLATRR